MSSAVREPSCISFDSYIKPQPALQRYKEIQVVSLLIPTSNHNVRDTCIRRLRLYLFWFLHQTTTDHWRLLRGRKLYLFWFLHQTTTSGGCVPPFRRCISFDSYIKPQLILIMFNSLHVVSLLIPTSNHNLNGRTTSPRRLYLFWFLHQTTTLPATGELEISCISFDSYIKPQLIKHQFHSLCVVSLLIPTSNHNRPESITRWHYVVSLLIPTSNHNLLSLLRWKRQVVSLLIPTSNHNLVPVVLDGCALYLFWFLHQTTTNYSGL